MRRTFVLAVAGLGLWSALTPASAMPQPGRCAVNVGRCTDGGACTVNYGTCSNSGGCTVNYGTCSGGRCLVSIGTCSAGETDLVAL